MTAAPWWSQLPGAARALRDYSLARSLLYFAESWPLMILNRALTNSWGPEFTPPKGFTKATIEAAQELLKLDAERAAQGMFPLALLKPSRPTEHLRSLLGVWHDGIRVAWRMRQRKTKDFAADKEATLQDLPDYYRRCFHYQSDGYLSRESAARYDHQVEILFKGAASAMRRLVLVPLVERFRNKKVKLLELGAGSGSATRQVAAALPFARITAVDLSAPYLEYARQSLPSTMNIDFVLGNATDLGFRDERFDGAFSVFMFHELPKATRLEVLREAWRVLKPGGLFVIVDSLQLGDVPALNWGLERFPKDFHEPFYTNYSKTPLEGLLKKSGFELVHQEFGLLSKCVAAVKVTADS